MSKLRILQTNFHKYMVGESRRVLAKVHGLQQRGHYVVLASPAKSAIIKRAQDMGLNTFTGVQFRSGFHPISEWRDIWTLRRLIKERRINIVHTHGSKDSWAGALAAWLSFDNVKVVRTRHNHYPVSRHLFNRWLYRRLTHRLVAISQYIKASFTKDNFVPPEKISLIYSAVDTTKFNPAADGQAFRQELGVEADEQLVGMVAFVIPRKGHKYFLEAATEILRAAEKRKLKFVIVGDGDDNLEAELKAQVQRAGLAKQILFTGFRPDVAPVLAGLDVFVLPTLEEALGMAIIEALAMEKPVVATRVGGVPEMVRHMETGLLVPPKDAARLSEAITTLLHDDKLARRLAKNGRKLVEREFSTTAMVNKTEELYYKLFEEKAN
jgi:glycosyltransferase involved in cell wall biosynthesis